jgi:hypothetical protein
MVVDRPDVTVMFTRAADEPAAIRRAWAELEAALGSLRGRKFYGAFDEASDEYRACVELRPGDEPAAPGLELGALAGGRYARVRLHGEPPGLYERIRPAFAALEKERDRDASRLHLEHYRRRDVVDLLLPIT